MQLRLAKKYNCLVAITIPPLWGGGDTQTYRTAVKPLLKRKPQATLVTSGWYRAILVELKSFTVV